MHFEKILGPPLDDVSESRNFNRNTKCSQDNPDVIFFMNKMEDYLVERNKAFIQLNSRGFKDSKDEGFLRLYLISAPPPFQYHLQLPTFSFTLHPPFGKRYCCCST